MSWGPRAGNVVKCSEISIFMEKLLQAIKKKKSFVLNFLKRTLCKSNYCMYLILSLCFLRHPRQHSGKQPATETDCREYLLCTTPTPFCMYLPTPTYSAFIYQLWHHSASIYQPQHRSACIYQPQHHSVYIYQPQHILHLSTNPNIFYIYLSTMTPLCIYLSTATLFCI